MRPVLPPQWVISALRPTVVPLMQRSQSETICSALAPKSSAISFSPFSIALVGFEGVDSALKSFVTPVAFSAMTKSVKVPPASMPRRYLVFIAASPHALRNWRDAAISTSSIFSILEHDTVIRFRPLDRDQAVANIFDDLLDRPLERVAVPASARIHVGDGLAGFDGLQDVGAGDVHLAATLQFHPTDFLVDQLRPRAGGAHRGNAPAFAKADAQHLLVERLNFPGGSGAAAEFPGARRIASSANNGE